jgi:hypothetical protein
MRANARIRLAAGDATQAITKHHIDETRLSVNG